MDKDLGRYDKWDSCADAVYVYNAGKYDADDEYDAANDGADEYDVNAHNASDYNDEVFWWSGYLQDDNDGDALVHRMKKEETANKIMMLIGGWYLLAADVILTQNSNSETGVDGERLQIKDVVDVNQLVRSYTSPIRQWNWKNSVGLACLGALFYALVRRNTRWRRKKKAREIVRISRWKRSNGVQQEIVSCSIRWRELTNIVKQSVQWSIMDDNCCNGMIRLVSLGALFFALVR